MKRPLESIGDLLLPERKLWEGTYGLALANTARAPRPDRPVIRELDDFLAWCEHVGHPLVTDPPAGEAATGLLSHHRL